MIETPVESRLVRNTTVDANGCWLWEGAVNTSGYGKMTIKRDGRWRTMGAHRVSYETRVGAVPAGLQLDHLCRVRLCINPAHLEPVTCLENQMRSPLTHAYINATKTACKHGHEFTPENTYYPPRGGERACRQCKRDSANDYNRRVRKYRRRATAEALRASKAANA